MRTIFAATLAAGCLLSGAASAQEQKGFRDWMVVCDNSRECAAFGFSREPSAGYLKIERQAGPGGRLEAGIAVLSFEGSPPAKGWTIRADGKILFDKVTFESGDWGAVWSVRGDDARHLVNAARNASSLTVEGPGLKVDIVLSGSSASMRFIDERQGRAGQQDALAAIGPASPAAAPQPPARPIVKVPAAPSQARLPVPPKSISAMPGRGDCDPPMEGAKPEILRARLGPNLMLWGVQCNSGAYNFSYLFFTTDEQGGNRRPVAFPYAPGSNQAQTLFVTNPEFDADTLTMSSFEKARGLGDCGAVLSWAWTGKAFALISQDIMSECNGVGTEHWPSLYRATADQAAR